LLFYFFIVRYLLAKCRTPERQVSIKAGFLRKRVQIKHKFNTKRQLFVSNNIACRRIGLIMTFFHAVEQQHCATSYDFYNRSCAHVCVCVCVRARVKKCCERAGDNYVAFWRFRGQIHAPCVQRGSTRSWTHPNAQSCTTTRGPPIRTFARALP